MRARAAILSSLTLTAVVVGVVTLTAARRGDRVVRVDFDKVVRATSPAYDARVAPVADAPIKEFRIPIKEATLEIAKGVSYNGWTFGGTVPGPVIHVRVGDLVRVTVVNESPMPHSIDFHAARIPPNVAYRMITLARRLFDHHRSRSDGAGDHESGGKCTRRDAHWRQAFARDSSRRSR
ncbi:MAG: multicopper oxidase domain-containing protein [Gemmatimonadaceae bacterium]